MSSINFLLTYLYLLTYLLMVINKFFKSLLWFQQLLTNKSLTLIKQYLTRTVRTVSLQYNEAF